VRRPSRTSLVGLLTAEALAMTGTRMSMLALPWLVLVTTGSAGRTGVIVAAEMAPYVAAGVVGAPLLDRLGARRVSIVADLGSGLAMGGITLGGRGGFGLLVAVVAILGTMRGFGDNAKRVTLPAVATAGGVNLTRASAVYDAIFRLSTLVGAPLAGVLIATPLGARGTVAVAGCGFAISSAILAAAVRAPASAHSAPTGEGYLTSLRGGLSYLGSDRLVLGALLMLFLTNMFDNAFFAVFVPVWIRDGGHIVAVLGVIGGSFALGALGGNVVFTVLATRLPRYVAFTAGFLIAGAPRFLAMGLTDAFGPVVAITLVAGIASATINPILSAVAYERIPVALRARVFGLATAMAFAGIPLGSLLGGAAVSGLGLATAALGAGALYLLATLTPLIGHRIWRQIDRPPVEAGVVPAQPTSEPTLATMKDDVL
jgi:Major Facilitator Superfamily